jgi:hypothetical protein
LKAPDANTVERFSKSCAGSPVQVLGLTSEPVTSAVPWVTAPRTMYLKYPPPSPKTLLVMTSRVPPLMKPEAKPWPVFFSRPSR